MREKKNLELISNITAKTLSRTKILPANLKLHKEHKEDNNCRQSQNYYRGLVDFFSFFERYTNKKIYNKFQPIDDDKRPLYEFFHLSRSHFFAINEFQGSYLNIKNYGNFILRKENINNEFFFRNFYYTSIYFCSIECFINKKIFNTNIEEIKSFFCKFRNHKKLLSLKPKLKNHIEFSKLSLEICNFFIKKRKKTSGKDESNLNSQKKLEKKNESKKKVYEDSKQITFQKKKIPSPQETESEINQNPNLNTKNEEKKYGFFTDKFDQIVNAEKICDKHERNELKKKLSEASPKLDYVIKKLALKLERKLFSRKELSWDFDDYEGILDSSRFAHIISNPQNDILYKKDKDTVAKNTIVSLLIDNSGSMRGRPIVIAANAVDILVKTLEKCGVKIEILGFTTKRWKGGKSRENWVEVGRIPNPGRLNDLLHIIYKDSDRNWKSCEKNLGIVLKEGLLKENIDGEALLWAEKRLLAKTEKKKILIVISDGAPVDDSTLSSNNSNLLEFHLKEVIRKIEKEKRIDLLAIGIGHDVSKYYKKAITITEVEKLAEVLLTKINSMFDH